MESRDHDVDNSLDEEEEARECNILMELEFVTPIERRNTVITPIS